MLSSSALYPRVPSAQPPASHKGTVFPQYPKPRSLKMASPFVGEAGILGKHLATISREAK